MWRLHMLIWISHSRVCTGICFPPTRTMGGFNRFNLPWALALGISPDTASLPSLLWSYSQHSWHLFFHCGSKLPEWWQWSTGNGIQCYLCGTENRALEEGVYWCQQEITLEICFGFSWPGLAMGKICGLTLKLMVAEWQTENSLWKLCKGKRI